MALTDTIRAGVTTAFNAAGDIPQQITVRQLNTENYDGNVMSVVQSFTDTIVAKAFVLDFESSLIDNEEVFPTDRKIIINGGDLVSAPANNDKIIIGGKEYIIIKNMEPTNEFIYQLQVRAISG